MLKIRLILYSEKQKYFCARGLTGIRGPRPSGKSRPRSRQVFTYTGLTHHSQCPLFSSTNTCKTESSPAFSILGELKPIGSPSQPRLLSNGLTVFSAD